jgi:hypothetical protein
MLASERRHGRGPSARRSEPRVGRTPDGLAIRLDRPNSRAGVHVWPAGRGEEQHASEPPRLVPPKTVANRSARLKALGNAVVWQQAEAAIRRALEVA